MDEHAPVFASDEVADHLGVSPQGLKKLARLYEKRYGALPRDEHLSRLWPAEAVRRLKLAQELLGSAQVPNLGRALDLVEKDALMPSQRSWGQTLAPMPELLLGELERLRRVSERQAERLELLEERQWRQTRTLEVEGGAAQAAELARKLTSDLQDELGELKRIAGPQAAERLVSLITPLYDGLRELKELQQQNLAADLKEGRGLNGGVTMSAKDLEELDRLRVENADLRARVGVLTRQLAHERDKNKKKPGLFARLFGND